MENKKVDVADTQFLTKGTYLLGNGPKFTIIEKVAGEFAGVFYDAARASGVPSQYRSAKHFARAKFTVFIPKAVEILTGMLDRQDLPDLMKAEIYDALIERANDPNLKNLIAAPDGKPTFKWGDDNKNPFMRKN